MKSVLQVVQSTSQCHDVQSICSALGVASDMLLLLLVLSKANLLEKGLAVNEDTTKYILATCRDVRCIGFQITAGNSVFDVMNEFFFYQFQSENQASNYS